MHKCDVGYPCTKEALVTYLFHSLSSAKATLEGVKQCSAKCIKKEKAVSTTFLDCGESLSFPIKFRAYVHSRGFVAQSYQICNLKLPHVTFIAAATPTQYHSHTAIVYSGRRHSILTTPSSWPSLPGQGVGLLVARTWYTIFQQSTHQQMEQSTTTSDCPRTCSHHGLTHKTT